MHYIKNLTENKYELYFSNKAEYIKLSKEKKAELKTAFQYTPSIEGWRSRALISNAWRADSLIKEWNIEYGGEEGEKRSFAEQVVAKQEKAELRLVHFDTRHTKLTLMAQQHFNAAHYISSYIPMGQPILAGHHSEAGHRRDFDRMISNTRKGREAENKADYYAEKYRATLATAEGKQYQSLRYLGNRIKECEANLRKYDRYLKGKSYAHSEETPISENDTNHWTKIKQEEQEKLDFFLYCQKHCIGDGKVLFNKELLKDKKQVQIRGRWRRIVKLNPTTVATPNTSFPTEDLQIKYALKYGYGEVQDAR